MLMAWDHQIQTVLILLMVNQGNGLAFPNMGFKKRADDQRIQKDPSRSQEVEGFVGISWSLWMVQEITPSTTVLLANT